MLDILAELGSTPPWIYRGWGYIFSSTYRDTVKNEYRKISRPFKVLDIILSASLFVAEVGGIVYLVYWAATSAG